MNSDEKNTLLALLGGETITVRDRAGKEEQVRVRELRISEFEKLLPVVDEEEKSAAVYCDRTEAWAAMLTSESLEAVITKGEELNAAPFDRWLTRRAKRTSRVGTALGTRKTADVS